jgi:hypothetical protein
LPALACLCKTLTGKQKAKDASGGTPDAIGGTSLVSYNKMSKNPPSSENPDFRLRQGFDGTRRDKTAGRSHARILAYYEKCLSSSLPLNENEELRRMNEELQGAGRSQNIGNTILVKGYTSTSGWRPSWSNPKIIFRRSSERRYEPKWK